MIMTETLEEVAERLYSDKLYPIYGSIRRDAFINGAKWQQERSYSEKEVIRILIKAYEDVGKRKIPNQVVLANWFEHFKKK